MNDMTVRSRSGKPFSNRLIEMSFAYERAAGVIEMSFAYERAAGVIESSCVHEEHEDALENGWWDLASSDEDLSDEVAYLESRRLIARHPEHPDWITIHDEGEPMPEVTR